MSIPHQFWTFLVKCLEIEERCCPKRDFHNFIFILKCKTSTWSEQATLGDVPLVYPQKWPQGKVEHLELDRFKKIQPWHPNTEGFFDTQQPKELMPPHLLRLLHPDTQKGWFQHIHNKRGFRSVEVRTEFTQTYVAKSGPKISLTIHGEHKLS